MDAKSISKAVISRLPRYYRYLGELLEEGVERISSNDLSKKMRVTASQIRQDLNNFGGFGQQGYGYNVQYLYTEIGKILGLDKMHHMLIVGAGNLGQALANYVQFEKRGFKVVGIFDVNPVLRGVSVRGIQIRMVDELPEFLKNNDIQIAALTLPKSNAKEMADILVANGVKAIWNFAHLDLLLPEDVMVENVHLSDSLMRLSYKLSKYENEHSSDHK
ncbi:MAG: redox-sensing transcriptional repressor Rex [Lachnospiraceae bacterium]